MAQVTKRYAVSNIAQNQNQCLVPFPKVIAEKINKIAQIRIKIAQSGHAGCKVILDSDVTIAFLEKKGFRRTVRRTMTS